MPSSAKNALRELVLRELEVNPYLSFQAIEALVNRHRLAIAAASIKVYLSQAVKEGLLHDAGRAWYSRLAEPVPLNLKAVASLIGQVEKAFPLLEFSCWSTAQINPWMHHVLAQPVAFLFAHRDELETIGEELQSARWDVAVNPSPSVGAKQVRPGRRSVVLRPALSRQHIGTGHHSPVEKILADLLAEVPRLALMDRGDAQVVVRSIVSQYLIQVSVFKSYLERRGLKVDAFLPVNQRQFLGKTGVG